MKKMEETLETWRETRKRRAKLMWIWGKKEEEQGLQGKASRARIPHSSVQFVYIVSTTPSILLIYNDLEGEDKWKFVSTPFPFVYTACTVEKPELFFLDFAPLI